MLSVSQSLIRILIYADSSLSCIEILSLAMVF